jgi:uncharacterized radical SAM protein YgiQ
MPSFEEVKNDKSIFTKAFKIFYENNDPLTAKGLCQKQDTRYLIQNPPSQYLSGAAFDTIFELPYQRDVHPYYKNQGIVKAIETIRFSITTHWGCYGECNFCAITVHQGRTVRSRSENSILKEAKAIAELPDFNGYITDVGGPTANMYEIECSKKLKYGCCSDKRCLFPRKCEQLNIDHRKQVQLLRKISSLKGIKKVFVASGIRYDMIFYDKKSGQVYLNDIVSYHVSGQLKIAPEHAKESILNYMGKTDSGYLEKFKNEFFKISESQMKKQFLTYYFMAAHPGCQYDDMLILKSFVSKHLNIAPEQVQIFTPTPSTYSTLMYYTEQNPFTNEPLFVEKDIMRKEKQKEVLTKKPVKQPFRKIRFRKGRR